jgi:hypothetical protein
LFRLIWRLNALVILGVGLVAGVVALWALVQIGRDVVRPRAVEGVLNPTLTDRRETLSLGGFEPAPGGRYLVAAIQGEQAGETGVYAKTVGSTRDLVVLDRATGVTKRVLGRLDQLILGWSHPVADRAAPIEPSLLLITVVEADTDGDTRLDGGDRRAVLACAPSGEACAPVVAGVDQVLSHAARPDGRVDLITTLGGKTEWRVIAADRSVSAPVPVLTLP